MAWEHTTLDAIRGDLSKVAEENNWERYHTPRNLLMALQKEVGDLAQVFRWDETNRTLHRDDCKNVEEELGDILAYTVRLADKCNIDLASVMNHKLQRHHVPIAPQQNGTPYPYQPAAQYQPSPTPQRDMPHTSPAISSPDATKALYAKSPHSTQSTHSGSKSPTNKNRPQPLDSDSLRKHDIASKRPAFKRTLSVVCKGGEVPPDELYSPTHFKHDLFSPVCNETDFEVDTKKPVMPTKLSKQGLLEEQAAAAPAAAAAPTAAAPYSSNAPPREPASPLSPKSLQNFFHFLDGLIASDFSDKDLQEMGLVFCGAINGRIVPLVEGGNNIPVTKELLPDFINLGKELEEKGTDYVAKAFVKSTRGGGGGGGETSGPFAAASASAATRLQQHAPGTKQQERKKTLRRTLSVQLPKEQRWDGEEEKKGCFSPTHFEKDLFSPTTDKTDFEVEYTVEGGRKTLPHSLSVQKLKDGLQEKAPAKANTNGANLAPDRSPSSNGKKTPDSNGVRRHSAASFCSDEDEEYRGLDLLLEVAEEDQEKLCKLKQHLRAATMSPRTRELDRDFLPMISDIETMLADKEITDSDLEEMDLMFCIPAGGMVHDLITDGRSTRVTLHRLPEFIALAKDKKRELEAAEA